MKLELTDLRSITRDSDTLRTEVTVHFSYEERVKWLVMGACDLRKSENHHDRVQRWWLDAKMLNATDFEHDTASAVRLPLVAVSIGLVYHNRVHFHALVEPRTDKRWHHDFNVPRPGYNPMEHEDACVCDEEHCQGENSHIIVPEGLYVPPFDEELYNLVAGFPVDIYMGQPYEEK